MTTKYRLVPERPVLTYFERRRAERFWETAATITTITAFGSIILFTFILSDAL